MSLKRKIPFICFLALTMFSVSSLSYTLYITFGTSWAIRSIKVSLSDVRINENGSKAYFSIVIYNPSSVHLGITFLRAGIYFNDSYIEKRELSFQREPLWLSTNTETNLTTALTSNDQASYSTGVWRLELTLYMETPLPQRARIHRSISLEE